MGNCSLFILHFQQSTKLFCKIAKMNQSYWDMIGRIQYFNQIEICKSILWCKIKKVNSLSNSNKISFSILKFSNIHPSCLSSVWQQTLLYRRFETENSEEYWRNNFVSSRLLRTLLWLMLRNICAAAKTIVPIFAKKASRERWESLHLRILLFFP